MSGFRASWITLAVCVAVTAACVVLFILEPVQQGNYTAVSATDVPEEHRIAAIDTQGRVVDIDDRDNQVARLLDVRVPVDRPDQLEIERNATGSAAYMSAPGPSGGEIQLVHLDTGGTLRLTDGEHPALSPDDQTLAFVRREDGTPHLVLRNAITGAEQDFGTNDQPALADVRALKWTPDGGQLLILTGSADQPVWRLPETAHQFREALPVSLPQALMNAPIEAITGYQGGFVVAQRNADRTSIVRVSNDIPGESQPLATVDGTVRAMDANVASDELLLVVDRPGTGTSLERWHDGASTTEHATDGILTASF